MRMLGWTVLALTGIAAAVLVTPAAAQEVEIKPAAKIKKDTYVITPEEIAERQDIKDAYQAVKLLRPNFLKATRAKGNITDRYQSDPYRPTSDPGTGGDYGGGGSSSVVAVLYLNDVKQQNLEDMRLVPATEVVEIRYMTGTEASSRYGAGHEGGAILLKTKKFGKQ